jgi:hypothetical protein
MRKVFIALFFLIGWTGSAVFAAVGCDLNDPDRDVKRLFPTSTSFKTTYLSLDRLGGETLLTDVETRLGDKFQGLYETIDVPYTVYTIYKGTDIIGYIHGINQKGRYGGLQVFLGYDTKGVITNFYYQKLTSQKAADMRKPEFAKQFIGLTLHDFNGYDPKTGVSANAKVAAISNPNPAEDGDFKATLRAVKKNLVLMDIFIFNRSV